jgi:malonate transporter
METTLNIVLPVFGLVVCGYLVGRTKILDEEGINGLANFVFYVAVPVLMFRSVLKSEYPELKDMGILFAYYGGCYLTFLIALGVGKLAFRLPLEQLAIFGMGSMYGNTVMLGLPLVYAIYGDAGMIPILLIIGFHNPLLITVTAIVVELGRGERTGLAAIMYSSMKILMMNPVVIAIFFALAWRMLGIPNFTPVDRFAELLGTAAAPCALFALGASLTSYKIAGNISESITIVILKLVLHPLLVWVLAYHVFALDPVWAAIATITAALPTGANVFIYSRGYGIYVARATSATLISTGLSIFSVGLLLSFLISAL